MGKFTFMKEAIALFFTKTPEDALVLSRVISRKARKFRSRATRLVQVNEDSHHVDTHHGEVGYGHGV